MKQDADWKILATLGFLVATIAVPTVVSLVSPETVEASDAQKVVSPEENSREPASVSKSAKAPSADHVINFDVHCPKPKTTSFTTEGSYIQLKGRDCSKQTTSAPMSITNMTNGFTASIFSVNKNEYQTDLIQLKDGENKISIQFHSSAGQTEEQVLKVKSRDI